ncbi:MULTISPECIES: patatin-like phospholipase family protein [unclassified Caulobacter]|uniref:patatin-like phospholipase family protein n=1 Tax=unclassified Caulobacter TaxID=2648921 RepID=UPI00070172F8|nr:MULTISPECIES: patatin-like phospholipase family protein [unclassified Caulobacter]KQV62464.1 patatin [Caulobacter sp. Root342]KQV65526.1 patatin [Caulobacter sp. Root343]
MDRDPTGKINLQGFFKDWKTNDPLRGKRLPTPPSDRQVQASGFPGVRLTVDQADDALRQAADRLAPLRSLIGRDEFNILALSGGAAGGAYGAGVLAGLSKSGRRPDFAIVTGVSTGALSAPMAFLGSAWDDRLTDAYVGGHATELLSLRRLAPALGPSIFKGESLDALVETFVDQEMVEAVAVEHAKGRRLLIATTNLDSQRAVVWDLGEIATHGGDEALKLFRTLLVASASVPGIFPPKLIDVQANDQAYQEMHVDGGVAAPLFLMPDALLHWRNLGPRFRRGRVHVIVNTVLDPSTQSTPPGVASIMSRSFDTMLRFSYRQALSLAAGFCSRHNLPLSVASIPNAFEGMNLLKFETDLMRRIYDAGFEQAVEGSVWTSAVEEQSLWRGLFKKPLSASSTVGTGVMIREEPNLEAPLEP